MGMFKALVEGFGGGVKFFIWFLSTVVIPLTFWFALLQSKVDGASAEIVEISGKIKEEKKLDRENFTEIFRRLDKIASDVGEIRGELRRIK
jgi:hypothetical protein